MNVVQNGVLVGSGSWAAEGTAGGGRQRRDDRAPWARSQAAANHAGLSKTITFETKALTPLLGTICLRH